MPRSLSRQRLLSLWFPVCLLWACACGGWWWQAWQYHHHLNKHQHLQQLSMLQATWASTEISSLGEEELKSWMNSSWDHWQGHGCQAYIWYDLVDTEGDFLTIYHQLGNVSVSDLNNEANSYAALHEPRSWQQDSLNLSAIPLRDENDKHIGALLSVWPRADQSQVMWWPLVALASIAFASIWMLIHRANRSFNIAVEYAKALAEEREPEAWATSRQPAETADILQPLAQIAPRLSQLSQLQADDHWSNISGKQPALIDRDQHSHQV